MKQFKPVIDRFKNQFFDGKASDPECGGNKKPANGAKPRGPAKKKIVEYERIILSSGEENEVSKEPLKTMKRKADDS